MVINGVLVVGFALVGLVVGALGRRLLARLRRGTTLPPPWCELACAGLSAVVGWRVTAGVLPPWWAPVPLLLCWIGVPLAACDLVRRRLPNALTLPAYPLLACAVAVAAVCAPNGALAVRAALGVVAFGGSHALLRLLAPRSLGAGDVKLAGSLGAVLGAVGSAAMVVAAVLAAMTTTALTVLPGRRNARAGPAPPNRSTVVPHGPGLLLATWFVAAFPGAGALTG